MLLLYIIKYSLKSLYQFILLPSVFISEVILYSFQLAIILNKLKSKKEWYLIFLCLALIISESQLFNFGMHVQVFELLLLVGLWHIVIMHTCKTLLSIHLSIHHPFIYPPIISMYLPICLHTSLPFFWFVTIFCSMYIVC